MGSILIVAEIQKGAIREASYELVAAAQGIEGGEVNGLVIGSGVGDLASEFASKRGFSEVWRRKSRTASAGIFETTVV